MRKLSLKNLKLEASEMLGRNQLKTVLGGYGAQSANCKVVCKNGSKEGIYSCSAASDLACKRSGGVKSCSC